MFQPRITCMSMSALHYLTVTLEVSLLFVLGIDRVMALVAPDYYRSLTVRGAMRLCGLIYLIIIPAKGLPLLLLSGDLMDVVSCDSISSGPGWIYNMYSHYLNLILCCATILLYLALAIRLRLRVRYLKTPRPQLALQEERVSLDQSSRSSVAEADIKRISKLMPTFRNLILVYCIFTFVAKLLMILAVQIQQQRGRFIVYAGIFVTIDQVVNVIVLMVTNRDIRRSCLAGIC